MERTVAEQRSMFAIVENRLCVKLKRVSACWPEGYVSSCRSSSQAARCRSGTAPGETIQGPFQEPRIEVERADVESGSTPPTRQPTTRGGTVKRRSPVFQKLAMRSSTPAQYTMGRGSRMPSSEPKVRRSSSRPTMEGWRKMMLLIVLTGEDTDEPIESRLLLAREADDDERRKEVRRVEGARRAARAWKREVCILGGWEEVEGRGEGRLGAREQRRSSYVGWRS